MRISEIGTIPAGEHSEEILVDGIAKYSGNIKCMELEINGVLNGDGNIECERSVEVDGACKIRGDLSGGSLGVDGALKIEGNVRVGGSCEVDGALEMIADGDLEAGRLSVDGAIRVNGNVKVEDEFDTDGASKIKGDVKCDSLTVDGALHAGGGIEAETVEVDGAIECGGLLNAESINVTLTGNCRDRAGSIGGEEIRIKIGENGRISDNHFFPKFVGVIMDEGRFTVDEYIEGDTVEIENVTVPVVTGRIVSIGAGCDIDTVRYSEQCEVSPDAKVGKVEQI